MIASRVILLTPCDWVNELCEKPTLAFMAKFEMPLDHRGAVVVYVFDMLVWKVDKGNVVEIPLRVIEIVDV